MITIQDTIYMGTAAPASGGGGSGDAVWGAITGTLSDQTDLQTALNAKQNTLTAGSGITINNGTISATGVESVANQNTNVGAISPLKVWNGTEQEWNTGGGSQTWYNWQNVNFPFTEGTEIATNSYIADIIYADNKFVVVGYDGEDNPMVAYSTDGQNWTDSQLSAQESCLGIAYGNNKFVAVGHTSFFYSTDGQNWTTGTFNSGAHYFDIAFGNNVFVAVGDSSFAYSSDGATWTEITTTSEFGSIAYGNNKFVTVSYDNSFAYSSDGQNWTYGTLSFIPDRVYYLNDKFIITEYDDMNNKTQFHYSTDGINWNDGSELSGHIMDIVYADNAYIAIGVNSGEGICAYSTDGINWVSGLNNIEHEGMTEHLMYSLIAYGNNTYLGLVDSYVDFSSGISVLSVFTDVATPTTANTVYSAPSTASALTITSVGTGTITLSDTNTYNYNASGNQTTTSSVGQAHPDYLCFINGVGVKIGTTTIAQVNAS